jgi:hypothetical protein
MQDNQALGIRGKPRLCCRLDRRPALTTPDSNAEVASTTGWRFKAGIGIVVLALLLWLSIPLAASLGLSGPRIAALTGAVFVAN